MSRHEGVSCDSCMKSNFTGNRYKCLVCYDYDLCSICYLARGRSSRHSPEHPMQCILTRSDFEVFHGGESVLGSEPQHQSYTCPLCGRLGFTEALLQEHVNIEHADSTAEVICPVCACYSNGDPNQALDDLAAHLMLEHRPAADFPVYETHGTSLRAMRRIAHHGRPAGSTRTRRPNMPPSHSPGGASNGSSITVLPAIERQRLLMNDWDDPIAELLSQSLARRNTTAAHTISSQLQQLEVQLQSTRQQAERLLPGNAETFRSTATITFPLSSVTANVIGSSAANHTRPSPTAASNVTAATRQQNRARFLLSRLDGESIGEGEREIVEIESADRSAFIQELLLSSISHLSQHLHVNDHPTAAILPQTVESSAVSTSRSAASSRAAADCVQTLVTGAETAAAAEAVGLAAVGSAPGGSVVGGSASGAVSSAAVGSETEASAAGAVGSVAEAAGSAAVGSAAGAAGSAAVGSVAGVVGSAAVGSAAGAAGSAAGAAGSAAVGSAAGAVGSASVGSVAGAAGSAAGAEASPAGPVAGAESLNGSVTVNDSRAVDGVGSIARQVKVRTGRRSDEEQEQRRVVTSSSSSSSVQTSAKRKPVVGRPSKEQPGKSH